MADIRTMNSCDISDSSSESPSTIYCAFPKFEKVKFNLNTRNKEILRRLELINNYIRHLENQMQDICSDSDTSVSFLKQSKDLGIKLHAVSLRCSTLEKSLEYAKGLLHENSINSAENTQRNKKEKKTALQKTKQQTSLPVAVLLQPPTQLPAQCIQEKSIGIENSPQDKPNSATQGSSAFYIKTLGHYYQMFTEVKEKPSFITKDSHFEDMYNSLQSNVDEAIKKISNLNYQLSCNQDPKRIHKLHFQLKHLANLVELKKEQMAKLEQFALEERSVKNNGLNESFDELQGDEVQIVTTIKSQSARKPLSVSHIARRNQDKQRLEETLSYQLKSSDLLWQ